MFRTEDLLEEYYNVPDGGLAGGVYGEKRMVPCSGATHRVRRTFVLPQ